jgi:hypothetical protein
MIKEVNRRIGDLESDCIDAGYLGRFYHDLGFEIDDVLP